MSGDGEKRALLAERLARKAGGGTAALPPAPAQERLWFLEQLTPGTALFNVPAGLRLTGPLDAAALERSLAEIVRRHAPLRTTFAEGEGGLPVQQVAPPGPFRLELTDLSDRQLEDARAEALRLGRAEAERPFDLSAGPLLRCLLLRVAPAEHLLVLVLHHIISDLWSVGVLVQELSALYGAFRDGKPSPLAPLPDNYPAYAARQRELADSPAMAEHLAYFRQQLGTNRAALQLPTDRPRPAVQSTRGALYELALPQAVAEQVKELARREGATLYMTMLAACLALLHRYTGQTDIIVGTPLANRNTPEEEQLIGLFANTLVLRTDLSGEPAFRELLARVRESCLGAYAHQEMEFARLVDALQPRRTLDASPLFQVMFALENADGDLLMDGVETEWVELHSQTAKFDLTVSIAMPPAGRLLARYEYNADLYEEATIARMAAHYVHLLAGAAADPGRKLSELPLLTPAEQAELTAWNETAAPYPQDQPLHRLIEAQAAALPAKPAVICGEEMLSYGELNRRANRLAWHLRTLGVGPDVLVGVCLERSAAMLVALLAVWKAGGAYVPMDPTYPRERLAYMLEDSGAPVVLTQSSLLAVTEGCRARVVCVDREPLDAHADENLEGGAGPRHLAYVIYTSGSTGRPKGVAVEHGATVNFLTAMRREPGLTAADTLLAVTSISFDIHVLELYLPLTAGGTVVLATRADALDGARLTGLITRHGVTMMQGTPSTWRLLLESGWQPRGLKMLVGGEAVPRQLADRLLAPGTGELWNMYGPTEATVWCTTGQIMPGAGPVLIGRPIANLQAHLLDSRLEPVPVGVAGELYIGGDGLARGYLNRPELTAERFIQSRWGRIYRTGDLVRRRPDGNLEFLGRADFQVKVRGFRIELGEVEAALERHPAIAQAVAAAREVGGETELVAYCTPRGQAPGVAELRAWLKEQLPDYMVPTQYLVLDRFPLTPNGKVDRKALPEPAAQPASAPAAAAVAPPAAEGDLERTIAAIWRAVLRVEQVGLNDNFFDLGGHSLKLVQVFSRLKQAVSCPLDLLELFQYPTVAALARFIRSRSGEAMPRVSAPVPEAAVHSGDRVDIAVVGMAGRFPGAGDIEQFWQNLRDGVDAVTRFTREELAELGEDPAVLNNPAFVPVKGVLEGADRFDAGFFGITPREAQLLDPQQRVFLETCWEALEHGGYDPDRYPARIGLWAGAAFNSYLILNVMRSRPLVESAGLYQVFISNDKDFVATRTAYKLNLKGPATLVGTACSTSLVAIHEASQALRLGECEMALAGAVSVSVPLREGYIYEEGSILSQGGVCRAFDAAADGTVLGNGVAAVLLKRLDDALRDGDTVYAVIRGSAVNNDGATKIGFTAPSAEGQARVVRSALQAAGVPAATITYVEAHGTGTSLGDPIEVAGLTKAFREAGATGTGYCALGSVKASVGHLDPAAGAAGFIKTVQALRYGQLPPSLHYETPNPKLGLESSPFFVNAALRPWETSGKPRRAGISSLGIGGTNAHVILEEAPAQPAGSASRPQQLLLLSARSAAALDRAAANLADHLKAQPGQDLADVAYTLAVGRKGFAHRRAVVAADAAAAAKALVGSEALSGQDGGPLAVAFLFPGQGAQHPAMLAGLYRTEPVFRAALDRCAGPELRRLICEGPAEELGQTANNQPALFAVEYALAQLWLSWGVRPRAMIGHSLGEYVAAVIAGVISLEDALTLVAARGKLMQAMPPGAMLAVPLPEADVAPLLTPTLAIAAVNGPAATVVSGPADAVAGLAETLSARGIEARRLHTSHAFHSAMMEPAVLEFAVAASKVTFHPPAIPFISNVTGTWITAAEATSPVYWARHLRQPVRFGDGLATLFELPDLALLEVGPGQTLTALARQHPGKGAGRLILPSCRHVREEADDQAVLLGALGRLWAAGAAPDWDGFWVGQQRRRVALPTYPFERQRYWIEAPRQLWADQPAAVAAVAPALLEAPVSAQALAPAADPPDGELEEAIAAIWQEVLGVERVNRHDSFFELGGDSLMASRAVTRLKELFPVNLPLSALFEAKTLAGLAARLEELLVAALAALPSGEEE